MSGWGLTETGKHSDKLKITEQTPVIPTQKCSKAIYNKERMLQFNKQGSEWNGVGSGDSGGKYIPVFCNNFLFS